MLPVALDPALPLLAPRLAVVVGSAVLSCLLMELVAAVLHGRVWHHLLWGVHESHHQPRTGRFERNDLLAVVNAAPAIALMALGTWGPPGLLAALCWGLGLGISVYGTAYLLVHDGFVHGRLPLGFLERSAWMRAVRTAHRVHHADGDAPFGLFLGPWELARRRARLRARLRA